MSKEITCCILTLFLWSTIPHTLAQPGKCDQTPPSAKDIDPEVDGPFALSLVTKDKDGKYLPDQTYVLILETRNQTRPFRGFMITVEDPDVDNDIYRLDSRDQDVGTLKIVGSGQTTQYSERCPNSVENSDDTDKYKVEVHWVSPKDSADDQKIRFRAMVAENKDAWYEGSDLITVLEKDNSRPLDSPPLDPVEKCNLCSEARYEIIFTGMWSRGTHPNKFPSKPDDISFSHLIGASHDINYVIWQQGARASEALKNLVENSDITLMERYIIGNMSNTGGTRTLIRGKRRRHPHMSEPTHSLLRVDRIHHLFSIVVAMRPSPDWFLGTSKFELCTDDGWLDEIEIPLYPWDAGTMDGISYDSQRSVTLPEDNVERVAVGSFNKESPFFQMNLIDLKPFATLKVRRLDVYPLMDGSCGDVEGNEQGKEDTEEENNEDEDSQDEPLVEELLYQSARCKPEWSEWSPCTPNEGTCGLGIQSRLRIDLAARNQWPDRLRVSPLRECESDDSLPTTEYQQCYIVCPGGFK